MSNLVDINGNAIEDPPHVAGCAEVLRLVAERMDEGGDLADADHVIVLVQMKNGAKFLAFDRGQTIATTLFMLECEKADLIDRARDKS